MTRAWIALGSNLGDRAAMIEAAVAALDGADGVEIVRRSGLVETEAVGPPGQAKYLNAVVEIRTSLDARALLDRCLAIEAGLGRDRAAGVRWGPRAIDLDLLMHGDAVIDAPGLHVPHPRMHERAFVLEPLAEIAPNVVHPVLRRSVQSLLADLPESGESIECI